jgi:glycosyltransferase involved in cell wall biosynthesis
MKISSNVRVLSIIFTHSHGIGGHYHSFNTINAALKSSMFVKSIELGWTESPTAVADEKLFANPFNIHKTLNKLVNICTEYKITHIHCYDLHASFYGSCISKRLKLPLVVTKCGGPNPVKYYTKCKNLICFSRENLTYFKARNLNKNYFLIPNRCTSNSVKPEPLDIPAGINFVSIGRIGSDYEFKHIKAINLIKHLASLKIDSFLTIIGIIESQEIYKKIEVYSAGSNVKILTTKPFINNSAKYLNNFDFSIGTGRGVMESLDLGLTTLICSQNSEYPLVLKEDNFNSAFDRNFSMRVKCDGEIDDLIKIIRHEPLKIENKKWCKKVFSDLFDVQKSVVKYNEVYQSILGDFESPTLRETMLGYAYITNNYIRHIRTIIMRKLVNGQS